MKWHPLHPLRFVPARISPKHTYPAVCLGWIERPRHTLIRSAHPRLKSGADTRLPFTAEDDGCHRRRKRSSFFAPRHYRVDSRMTAVVLRFS